MRRSFLNINVLIVLAMGFSSVLVQITALRQLLTVFSGNELVIGITLSVWLAAVGAGSYVGRRFSLSNPAPWHPPAPAGGGKRFHATSKEKRSRVSSSGRSRCSWEPPAPAGWGSTAFGATFLLIALLVQPTITLMEYIRPLFNLTAGETVPLTITVASTLLSLMPICFVIGVQFPLSVAFLNNNLSKTYSLEAAGAFMGGMCFTFLLSGRIDGFMLAAGVSMLNIIIALMLIHRKWIAVFAVVPFLMHFGVSVLTDFTQDPRGEPDQRIESRYGVITTFESQDQITTYASGQYAFSYPDAQTEELKAHVPMTLHPAPVRVLLVGGSPAVARELLKYRSISIDLVEADPAMIDASFSMLTRDDRERLATSRLMVRARDARQYIKSAAGLYDLVVLNLPEPATANLNRYYTLEFFQGVRTAMTTSGVLALNLPSSHGYIGKRMQAANGSVYRALAAVFKYVAFTSEDYGGMYASDTPIDSTADRLIERFRGRGILTEYFHPLMLKDIFDPLRTAMVRSRLETTETVNRDRRPVAYLFNLMLWADMHGGRALNRVLDLKDRELFPFLAAVLLVAIAVFWKRRRTLYYTLFTTGCATMSFSIVVLLAYQASFGSLFEQIGMLTALFMAGSAAGAYGAGALKAHIRALQLIEMLCLLMLIATPLFFTAELLYYGLTFLCGMVGGAEFVLVNRAAIQNGHGGSAGGLYALDLMGSVFGALLTALFFVPLLGIGNTVLALFALKASSLVLLFSVEQEQVY